VLILGLAERFGQLPSTISATPADELLPLLELERLSRIPGGDDLCPT
jgi:hypothetical protein